MKEVLKRGMLKCENSFFSHVVRCALGMIIPLVLTGGIACAVRDFPVAPYQTFHRMQDTALHRFQTVVDMGYGTFQNNV